MSGMYNRVAGLGLSIMDIPGMKQIDESIRAAVQSIIQKYAEFEQISLQAPKAVEEARKIYSGLREMNASPVQIAQAQEYLTAAQQTAAEVAKRGPIDQVMAWVQSVTGQQANTGLSAVPIAVPLWIAGTAVAALYLLTSTIKSWNNTRTVRSALQAGLSPEQIAKLGVGRSPFQIGLFGATSAVTVGVLAVAAFLGYRMLQGK